MKNLKYKIVLLLFVVLIAVIIGLCFIIQEKNKEIQKEKTKINKLEEEIKKQKTTELEKHPIEIKVEKCMEKCSYTTSCMTNCVYGSINDWEQLSKENLQELKKILSDEQYKLLLNSENTFESYKKAEIKFLYATVGNLEGSIYSNILSAKIANIEKQRANNLSEILYFLKKGTFILP